MQGPKFLILFLLISLGMVYATLFTPSMPEVTRYFGVSEAAALSTMTLFLAGYTVGMLPYGPLANRWGRKVAINIGLALALLGSLISLFSQAFWLFCLGRFIQALGCSVGPKITFTLIGDQFHGIDATRKLSHAMIALGVAPGIGIALGGFLAAHFGWHGCFAFLALYAIALGFLCRLLPETSKTLQPDALRPVPIAKGYLDQVKNPDLVLNAILLGLATSVYYIFPSEAPAVGILKVGLSQEAFGLYSLIPSLGLVLSFSLVGRLSHRYNPKWIMLAGIILVVLTAAVQGFYFKIGAIQAWSLFIPLFFGYAGVGLLRSNVASQAVSSASDKSNASAVIQFISIGTNFIAVWIMANIPHGTPLLLPASLGAVGIAMLLLWTFQGLARK